jgi:hypothetical protein
MTFAFVVIFSRNFVVIFARAVEKIGKTKRLLRDFIAPQQTYLKNYFAGAEAAGEAFALAAVFALGLVDLAGAGGAVRRRRFLSRFLAWARLRVFSRALSFGICGAP